MSADPHTYKDRIREAVMRSIVECSLTETDGVKTAHIHVAELLDALTPIIASMMATSEEASTAEGTKRILRRYARQLERQVGEFQQHSREHGSPFVVA
jgi:hypothetical protein